MKNGAITFFPTKMHPDTGNMPVLSTTIMAPAGKLLIIMFIFFTLKRFGFSASRRKIPLAPTVHHPESRKVGPDPNPRYLWVRAKLELVDADVADSSRLGLAT